YPQSYSEVADYKVIAAYRKFSANNAWSPRLGPCRVPPVMSKTVPGWLTVVSSVPPGVSAVFPCPWLLPSSALSSTLVLTRSARSRREDRAGAWWENAIVVLLRYNRPSPGRGGSGVGRAGHSGHAHPCMPMSVGGTAGAQGTHGPLGWSERAPELHHTSIQARLPLPYEACVHNPPHKSRGTDQRCHRAAAAMTRGGHTRTPPHVEAGKASCNSVRGRAEGAVSKNLRKNSQADKDSCHGLFDTQAGPQRAY